MGGRGGLGGTPLAFIPVRRAELVSKQSHRPRLLETSSPVAAALVPV